MLSVIHPSSTQQHIGAFRSSNSYHNSDSFGFPGTLSSGPPNHMKWIPSNPSCQSGVEAQWPASSAAYLLRHHPQYTNSSSSAFVGVSSSFKFYNYPPSSPRSLSSSQLRSNRCSSTSSSNGGSRCSSASSASSNLLPPPKDYSKPLFVDCSIEYELPNAPKIPKNSEPILMIHPAYNKQLSRSIKRASSSLSKSSSRGVSTSSKSKGVKRTHSQLSSTDVILSNQVALLQHQQQLQFSHSRHGTCHYGSAPPPAKRSCPSQEQVKQHEFRQQQVQQQYYWQAMNTNNSRCNNSYSHLPPQQPTDYSCWLPTPTSSAALAYYKAQLRMRQQESFLKSISQEPATPQSFCLDCVQGKCSQVAWNKENLGFMRSL